jgi:hypothetical protein
MLMLISRVLVQSGVLSIIRSQKQLEMAEGHISLSISLFFVIYANTPKVTQNQ